MIGYYTTLGIVIFCIAFLTFGVFFFFGVPKLQEKRYKLVQRCTKCTKFFPVTGYFEEVKCTHCGFFQKASIRK